MAYTKDQRLEVYAKAQEGLIELEADPKKRIKYFEFIDLYAGLSDEETARYREAYLKKSPQKEEIMGLSQSFREEGRREGWREGILEGVREGLVEGIELALSLKFGDESRNLTERIAQIKDVQRLKAVKEAVLAAKNAEDFRRRLEH
jgi:flagellar biosynthesis/type III secretory pathway protein FliH